MIMYSIQEIEKLDLDSLEIKEISKIRDYLETAFYYTRMGQLLFDGRHLKIVIGDEIKRLSEYLWYTDRIK